MVVATHTLVIIIGVPDIRDTGRDDGVSLISSVKKDGILLLISILSCNHLWFINLLGTRKVFLKRHANHVSIELAMQSLQSALLFVLFDCF
jgi:hypothetical protein